MPKFLFCYHGGDLPEESMQAVGIEWGRWLDGLGDKVIDRGGPLKTTMTLATGGQSVAATDPAHEVTGYSIIRAAHFDEALAIAKGCPQTRPPHQQGSIEIAELHDI